MFALIKDGTINKYPYAVTDLRLAHPNVSFPAFPNDETLASFGLHRVQPVQPPAFSVKQVLEELTPVYDAQSNQWKQAWKVRDKTASELVTDTQLKAESIRQQRNQLLFASDWTQLADSTVDKQLWATYRQALRDVPSQTEFPWNVQWPTQP